MLPREILQLQGYMLGTRVRPLDLTKQLVFVARTHEVRGVVSRRQLSNALIQAIFNSQKGSASHLQLYVKIDGQVDKPSLWPKSAANFLSTTSQTFPVSALRVPTMRAKTSRAEPQCAYFVPLKT